MALLASWSRSAVVRLAVAACLACGITIAAPAQEGLAVGVNVVNPQWLSRPEQEAIFDQLGRAGVELVRVPFVRPTGEDDDGAVRLLQRIQARGFRIALILYPEFPRTAPIRPAVPSLSDMWPLPALSAADPVLFRERYGAVFRKLDDAGVALEAIELGNEINWTAFNGEFPIPGRGRVYGYEDLEREPIARRVAAGFRAYIRTAAELKRIRDGSRLNARTPIVSAGLADLGAPGPRRGEVTDAVSIPATLRYLREHGLDEFVDGYGVHTYPEIDASAAARNASLRTNVLAECRPPGAGKPCWLTEWGFPTRELTCPAKDESRAALVAEVMNAMREFSREGRLRAAIYYQWSGSEDPLGVYRCGGLTESGRLATIPRP